MKTIHLFLTILIMQVSLTAKAQQWCTEQYNPEYGLIGDPTDNPDYGKEYSIYFYCTSKTLKQDIRSVTKIYKVNFTNYDGDKLMPRRVMGRSLIDDTREWLKSNFSEYSFSDIYISYCLSISDIQGNYNELLTRDKEKNIKTLILKSLKPNPVSYNPSAKGVGEQTVTFIEVK